jgi:WD40 repeat protein
MRARSLVPIVGLQIGVLSLSAPIFGVPARAQTFPKPKTAAKSPSKTQSPAKIPLLSRQLIGSCEGVTVLEVSPDGKWLLAWDGVTQRAARSKIGPRWVWDLTTGKSRSLRSWSETENLDFQECAWTPDNRIYALQRPAQTLIEARVPYAPRVFLQKPDGTGKIVCFDPPRSQELASREAGAVDVQFSPDGREIWLLSRFYWRRFDARTGKLRERRLRVARGALMGPLSLSNDGKQVLARDHWKVFDAKSGRLLLSLARPNGATLVDFWENDQYIKTKDGFRFFCRLSDDKAVLKIPKTALLLRGYGPNLAVAGEKDITQFDKSSGQSRKTLPKLQGNWVAMTISRNSDWIYAVNPAGQIYKWKTA